MRRAPSNTISSNIDRDRTTVDSSTATFNIGVPSSPGLHPRSSSRLVKKEGTPRPRTHRRSTTSGHTSEYEPMEDSDLRDLGGDHGWNQTGRHVSRDSERQVS